MSAANIFLSSQTYFLFSDIGLIFGFFQQYLTTDIHLIHTIDFHNITILLCIHPASEFNFPKPL